MPRGIQWRIALSYVALVTLAMLALGVYLVSFLRAQQFQNLETQLIRDAKIVAMAATARLETGGQESIDQFAKQLGAETGLRITIIAPDGQVLGDSDADPSLTDNHADRPEIIQALRGGTGEILRHSATVDRNLLYLAVPMSLDGQLVGVARVALPSSQIEESINAVATAVSTALVVTALLAVALAVMIARAIALPIQALTDSARRLAQGLPHRELPVNAPGEVGELAAVFSEMDARVREHLHSLEHEHARLAAVLAHIPDGVIILDSRGIITLTNRAAQRLLDLPDDSPSGRSLIQVTRDHELSDLGFQALRLRTAAGPSLIELGSGESRRSIQAVAAPLPAETAPGAAALVVLQDITEVRRMEAVRRDFVANVSHELRTPVASVKAMVETLEEGALEEPEVARDFLARIQVEVDGLTVLIEELMELSRIESGRVQLNRELVDVREAVEGAALRLQAQAERQGVTLSLEVGEERLTANIDADRIQQVIINLVHNAIKATEPGGSIRVGAHREGGEIRITVRDDGIGIERHELGRLFERFYKVDKSRSSGGTGLGLAIAKHLTQAHGGRIWAQSGGRGKGATFTVALPNARSAQGRAPTPSVA